MIRRSFGLSAAALAALSLIAPLGCSDKGSSAKSESGVIAVTSTATECTLDKTSVEAGKVTFRITNQGSDVTEFYLYGADGKKIVSEAENIGPSLDRDMTATVSEGKYVTACKPGMKGAGIRGELTVTAKS